MGGGTVKSVTKPMVSRSQTLTFYNVSKEPSFFVIILVSSFDVTNDDIVCTLNRLNSDGTISFGTQKNGEYTVGSGGFVASYDSSAKTFEINTRSHYFDQAYRMFYIPKEETT